MKHVNNSRRGRSRGSNSRRSSSKGHGFEGGDIKVRGNAKQVLDKYMALARDAALLGDRVASEEYFQRAEHYYRILHAESSADEQNAHARRQPRDQNKVKPECVEPDNIPGTAPGTAKVSDTGTAPGTVKVSDTGTAPGTAKVSDTGGTAKVSDTGTAPGTVKVSDTGTAPGTAKVSDTGTAPGTVKVSDTGTAPGTAKVSDTGTASANVPGTASDDKAQKADVKPKPKPKPRQPKIRAKTATA